MKNRVTLTSPAEVAPHSYALPGWRGEQSLEGKADAALRTLRDRSPGLSQVLNDHPLAQTLANYRTYDARTGYSQLRPRLGELYATLMPRYGEQLTLHYGLALLAALIDDHARRWPESKLDAQLEPCFIDSFHRILTAVSRG